jgi:hypothetical protein
MIQQPTGILWSRASSSATTVLICRSLREAFLQAAKEFLGQDFRGMDDETHAGEYYIDSLSSRRTAIVTKALATLLLKKLIDQKGQEQPVGLLVDKGNPGAERLYRSLGFEYVNDTTWGGHEMRHLQTVRKASSYSLRHIYCSNITKASSGSYPYTCKEPNC